MKLGYISIQPQPCANRPSFSSAASRATFASSLGFSEFYRIKTSEARRPASPEHAALLDVLPEPAPAVPLHLVGRRQGAMCNGQTAEQTQVQPTSDAGDMRARSIAGQATMSASWLSVEQIARQWQSHVMGSTHAALRTRPEDWRVARTVFVCEDPKRAEAAVKAQRSPCRSYYRSIAPQLDDAGIDKLIDGTVLFGSPDEVAEKLRALVSATSAFGTLSVVDHAWSDTALASQSLALLAGAVWPQFQAQPRRKTRELVFA